MPIADIGGAPHAYQLSEPLVSGQAENSSDETLVFIHGWLLSQAYWQPLVAQLSACYRCLTYDMRGFGDSRLGSTFSEISEISEKPRQIQLPLGCDWYPGKDSDRCSDRLSERYTASAYSLAAYAQDLGELLDYLGLDQVWLVGHSLGGSVALWAAYLLPDRVKGVICMNAGGGIYIPKEFEKFRAAGRQMVKFRPLWLTHVPLLPQIFSRAMVHQRLDIRWGKQRIRDFVRADRAAAEGALLESTTCEEVHQLPQLVGQLTQPVYFITASQDEIMPPRYVRYLASFHPRFEQAKTVLEIADCGHMAMVEQPQAVVDAIKLILAAPG
jgi:2-succinyl-6-hydroxy-2,4-cyclohexadiene-1-carboxylate synthase